MTYLGNAQMPLEVLAVILCLACTLTAALRVANDRADAGTWAIAAALFLAVAEHLG